MPPPVEVGGINQRGQRTTTYASLVRRVIPPVYTSSTGDVFNINVQSSGTVPERQTVQWTNKDLKERTDAGGASPRQNGPPAHSGAASPRVN